MKNGLDGLSNTLIDSKKRAFRLVPDRDSRDKFLQKIFHPPWLAARHPGLADRLLEREDLPPVDLSTYLKMDPNLLLGLLNTELRNHCDSLDDLVKKHGLDPKKLVTRMKKAGYEYREEQNQFR